jgi:hypothetical protein
MGVSEVNFHVVSDNGNCKSNPDLLITASEWLNLIELIEKIKDKVKIKVKYPKRFVLEEKYEKELENGYHCILRDVDRLHVLPDGRVYNCCLFFDTNFNSYHFSDKLVETPHSERTLYESNPQSSCIAADLLGIGKESKYKSLCVHWKKYI